MAPNTNDIHLSEAEKAAENYLRNVVAPSYNVGGIEKLGQWNGQMTESHLGQVKFENRVLGEPLDLVSTQRWSSWGITIDKCKICDSGPHVATYEVHFEWGDTKKYEYISEICAKCMTHIYQNLIRNNQKEKEFY